MAAVKPRAGRGIVKNLKIRVFKGRADQPDSELTLPLSVARLAGRLLPRVRTAEWDRQGLDIRKRLEVIARENLRGTLMAGEKGGKRTVISVE